MIYPIISIAIITLVFAYLFNKKIINFCPICAGVAITWVIGLLGIYTNMSWANPVFVGLLMAGTIGALAEKYGNQKGLLWKSGIVLVGFPAVYYLASKNLALGILFGACTLILILSAFKRKETTLKEDVFKNCC